jgi:hypothetical protein
MGKIPAGIFYFSIRVGGGAESYRRCGSSSTGCAEAERGKDAGSEALADSAAFSGVEGLQLLKRFNRTIQEFRNDKVWVRR